jgi:hypothetical protein|nr:hypothetical protein [Brevundimonas naejangsanensis]
MWTVQRTPEEVAQYLRDFIEGTGGEWDWDDFASVTIKDQALESIRHRATRAEPLKADIEQLRKLLAEAETLCAKPSNVR